MMALPNRPIWILPGQQAKAWRGWLQRLAKGQPEAPPPAIQVLLDELKVIAEEDVLAGKLSQLLHEAAMRMNDLLHVTFMLVCHILDFKVSVRGQRWFKGDDDLSLPQPIAVSQGDTDRMLAETLNALSEHKPDLNADLCGEVTFLQWLQALAKLVCEQSLPIPATESTLACFLAFIAVTPASIEGVSGRVAASFLFNIDHVDCTELFTSILASNVKLRQFPKFVARLILAAGQDGAIRAGQLPAACFEAYNQHVGRLTHGQAVDLWRTFLFHLSEEAKMKLSEEKRSQMLELLNDLLSGFFEQVAVIDFKVPKMILAKILDLCQKTSASLQDPALKKAQKAFTLLSLALKHYRKMDLSVDVPEFERALDDERALALADQFFHSNEPEWVDMMEEEKLQRALMVTLSEYLSESLDCDQTCERILKPFAKNAKKLMKEDLNKLLARSFKGLNNALTEECFNHELDEKAYFNVPLRILECLPLECLENDLNLLASVLTVTLMLVCTHPEANDRLLLVLARCVDPLTRPCWLLKHVDGGKLMLFLARMRLVHKEDRSNLCSKLIAQNFVKHLKDMDEKWTRTRENVAILANVNVRAAAAAVEALEPVLTHRDASEEKMAIASDIFRRISANFLRNLAEDGEFSKTHLRFFTSMLKSNHEEELSEENAEEGLHLALDLALEELNGDFLRTVLTFGGNFAKFLPQNFAKKLWKKLLKEKNEDVDLLTCTLEKLSEEDVAKVSKKQLEDLVQV